MDELRKTGRELTDFTPEERARILHDLDREYKFICRQEKIFNSLFAQENS